MSAISSLQPYFLTDSSNRSEPHQRENIAMTGFQADTERRWQTCIDELLKCRSLSGDWDGDGALAPLPEIVDPLISLVKARGIAVPPSRVVPINDGRISLEWDNFNSYVSISFSRPFGGRIVGRQMTVDSDGSVMFADVSYEPLR